MNNNNRIRTYPIKSLVIFLSICFVVSTGMLVLFSLPFMESEMWVIKILVWVLCSIFSLASLIVLIQQLFFWIEVRDDVFIQHNLLSSFEYLKSFAGLFIFDSYSREVKLSHRCYDHVLSLTSICCFSIRSFCFLGSIQF